MQITITIPDEIAAEVQARLAAEARAQGLEVDRYLTEKLVGTGQANRPRELSPYEAVERMRKLRQGNLLGGLTVRELIESGRRF